MFIDLRHPVEGGSVVQDTAKIRPFLAHEQTLPKFDGRAFAEI